MNSSSVRFIQGFLRTKVMGITVDVSPFVPLESDDPSGAVMARGEAATTSTTELS